MSRLTVCIMATLALTGCATTAHEQGAHTTVETVRVEQEMGRVDGQLRQVDVLSAGQDGRDRPFSFTIRFDGENEDLGTVNSVTWTVTFDEYCRDRPSWVQSILVGPAGQVWRGYRVGVPAGPDRSQYWSSGATGANGPGAVATPGLLEAMDRGGVFTIAFEDDEGRRWTKGIIDTLSRADREALFAAERARRAAEPVDDADTSRGLLSVVALPPFIPSASPPPCP